MEEEFSKTKGVVATTVGYAGGTSKNPTYGDVCSGTTGHAEVVEVEYDPAKVSYEHLLDVFFGLHNPTSSSASYRGGQYRSLIFAHSPEQLKIAQALKSKLEHSGKFNGRPIMTEIASAPTFWRAEDYHQHYYQKSAGGFCGLFSHKK